MLHDVDDIIFVDKHALESQTNVSGDRQSHFQSVGRSRHFAAISQQHERYAGRQIDLVACRVNIESDLLLSVLRRGMTRLGKLVRLRVEISNEPTDLK